MILKVPFFTKDKAHILEKIESSNQNLKFIERNSCFKFYDLKKVLFTDTYFFEKEFLVKKLLSTINKTLNPSHPCRKLLFYSNPFPSRDNPRPAPPPA